MYKQRINYITFLTTTQIKFFFSAHSVRDCLIKNVILKETGGGPPLSCLSCSERTASSCLTLTCNKTFFCLSQNVAWEGTALHKRQWIQELK